MPVLVDGAPWGALIDSVDRSDAFDEDDAELLRAVAHQVGAALRSALLLEQLERAYLGTAEALKAALEAKDASTAGHPRSLVQRARPVGPPPGAWTSRPARAALRAPPSTTSASSACPRRSSTSPGR